MTTWPPLDVVRLQARLLVDPSAALHLGHGQAMIFRRAASAQ